MLLGVGSLWQVTLIHAFMGDYRSATDGDMAVVINIKNSDIDYDSDDTDAGDIDRKIFAVGLATSIAPRIKLFGSFNFDFDGELGGGDVNLDSGYSVSAGGSYMVWEQIDYFIQAFGQFNYIIEETFEYSEGNTDFTLDGYETLIGIMGTYKFTPQLHLYGAVIAIPFNDYTMDVSGDSNNDTWDLERDQNLGIACGIYYDLSSFFIKGEINMGTEDAYGLFAGMNF
jgi:hypothetical protein